MRGFTETEDNFLKEVNRRTETFFYENFKKGSFYNSDWIVKLWYPYWFNKAEEVAKEYEGEELLIVREAINDQRNLCDIG